MENYFNYRWFVTSSDKMVVGGKSAEQNDELLTKLKSRSKDFIVMHTSSPGSPFSVILADKKNVSPEDLEQTALFTACFSRAWKERKKSSVVDIFSLSQLSKSPALKSGTWQVVGKIQRKSVSLKLVLTKQKSKLRAVPQSAAKKFFCKIRPGKNDKTQMLGALQAKIPEIFSEQDFLSALPSGGVQIVD